MANYIKCSARYDAIKEQRSASLFILPFFLFPQVKSLFTLPFFLISACLNNHCLFFHIYVHVYLFIRAFLLYYSSKSNKRVVINVYYLIKAVDYCGGTGMKTKWQPSLFTHARPTRRACVKLCLISQITRT